MSGAATQTPMEKTYVMPMPKHIPFPDFPLISELGIELMMFLFTVTGATLQFINIYRTNWWLPESYVHHTLNLNLIDPNIVIFIVTLASRRLIYCLLIRGLELLSRKFEISSQRQRLMRSTLKYSFANFLLGLLSFSVWKIHLKTSYFSLFLLLYPLLVYVLIFGFNIEPFLRTQCEVNGTYFNGLPMHSCSANPPAIRDEIDVLRNDFNLRVRQMIFTAILNAYYYGFIPCFFANGIYYKVIWATLHVMFLGLSCLMISCAFLFPSRYSDILHRASLHLGYWAALDNCNKIVQSSAVAWNKTLLFMHSSIVRHNGEYFRSFGPVTVATPGNVSHIRFHRLFRDPSLIYRGLAILQICITLSQIYLLYLSMEWHSMLSIAFVAMTNEFILYKTMRDFFITRRIYATESLISAKNLGGLHED